MYRRETSLVDKKNNKSIKYNSMFLFIVKLKWARPVRMHKSKAGKLQSGSTFPKQYWPAVNGKPKTTRSNGIKCNI